MSHILTNGASTIVSYPYSIAQLRRDNPNTSFPRNMTAGQLAAYNVFDVVTLAKPAFNPDTQACEPNSTPTYSAGVWELGWTTRPLTQSELAKKRDRRFVSEKEAARNFGEEESDILLAGYLEVKLVRLAVLLGKTPASVDTPVINAINAVFPGQTKLQIAQTVENRAQNYLTSAATALANKIKDGG